MNTPQPAPDLIYKITTTALFNAAQRSGILAGMPVDIADGYMHFSTAGQLPKTLSLHFAGQADLMLIAVRTADAAADLKWEASRGGALFPHLYAPLPVSRIAWSAPISVAVDGSCDLPEAVQ
jgi:uncharacterized protein (DUF952 family)